MLERKCDLLRSKNQQLESGSSEANEFAKAVKYLETLKKKGGRLKTTLRKCKSRGTSSKKLEAVSPSLNSRSRSLGGLRLNARSWKFRKMK
jgi:hypothetical protein